MYSQQLGFRRGASEQAKGVYSQSMTNGERATTPKAQERRVNEKAVKGL